MTNLLATVGNAKGFVRPLAPLHKSYPQQVASMLAGTRAYRIGDRHIRAARQRQAIAGGRVVIAVQAGGLEPCHAGRATRSEPLSTEWRSLSLSL